LATRELYFLIVDVIIIEIKYRVPWINVPYTDMDEAVSNFAVNEPCDEESEFEWSQRFDHNGY